MSKYTKETSPTSRIILLLHVDDFAAAATLRSDLTSTFDRLNARFGLRNEGPLTAFLSYEITRDRSARTLTLHQQSYISSILSAAHMDHCAPSKHPGDIYLTISSADSPSTPAEIEEMTLVPYREIIGMINHLAVHTRPEITYHLSSLSRFVTSPGPRHWLAAKHLLRYLKGTASMGLLFKPFVSGDLVVTGWSDASFASCLDTGRSSAAFFFSCGSGAISWKSKFLSSVSPSSTDSEVAALFMASSEAVWLRKLLASFGYHQSHASIIYGDNQASLKYAHSHDRAGRMKHIDVKFHFTREQVTAGAISVRFLRSKDNPADLLTKPLTGSRFLAHRDALGLSSLPASSMLTST